MNCFNNYVKLVEYDKKNIVAYNTYNMALALIDKNNLKGRTFQGETDELQELTKLEFFRSSKEIFSEFDTRFAIFRGDTLSITIEIAEACNLNCVYCYQNNWVSSGRTDLCKYEILNFIEKLIVISNPNTISVKYIGGEPTLSLSKLLFFHREIRKLAEINHISFQASIDTNGLFLSYDLVCELEDTSLMVTLSREQDHDRKRVNKLKQPTYSEIIHKLLEIRPLLEGKGRKLYLRYNTDHSNLLDYPIFLEEIKSFDIPFKVITARIINHKYNTDYENFLSEDEFKAWNSTTAIDHQMKLNLPVLQAPPVMNNPCSAYNGFNCKIWLDGALTACNAIFPNAETAFIKDLDPKDISKVILEKKMKPYSINPKCESCPDIFICGGDLLCKEKICDIGDIDIEKFLKTYTRYALEGKAHMFEGFSNL